MKRLLFLVMIMIIGIGLLFLSGCDDDEETTGPSQKAIGDPQDPMFLAIEEGFSGIGEMTPELLFVAFDFMDTIFSGQGQPAPMKGVTRSTIMGTAADSVMYTYHSNTNYWYLYVSWEELINGDVDTISYLLEDSLQFLHGVTPVQWPDSALMTGFKTGGHIQLTSTETVSYTHLRAHET